MNDILFGNNNKAVIKKLANRSFRSNKMRNVIAVIAIALTTFLFTAVLTIGMGAKGTLEYNMAKMIGTGADALVQGLSEEQFQQLKENSMFEKVGCWVPIEIMTNTNRMVAEIDYADQPQLELRMQTPRTGSAPQKANEVLVSANILKDLNIEEKIGAEIPIEFKNRQSGQMYHFDMIVSGIYNTPNEKSESVIVSKAFMEKNPEMMREIAQGREGCGIYDADVIMRDSSMVKERISEFVRSIGGNPDDRSAENYVRVAPNTFLSNNSGGSIMWLVAGVFGVLFMFCGYLLIYNVFEIAVTNDIRQYGLLRTVGTTSQQIKRLVNRQALYLFLIGTPFGLLFGILLGRSILPAALHLHAGQIPHIGTVAAVLLGRVLEMGQQPSALGHDEESHTGHIVPLSCPDGVLLEPQIAHDLADLPDVVKLHHTRLDPLQRPVVIRIVKLVKEEIVNIFMHIFYDRIPVHPVCRESHRGRLQNIDGLNLILRSRLIADLALTGTVDHHLAENDGPPAGMLADHAFHLVALADNLGHQRMQHQLHTVLPAHPVD